MLTPDHQVSGRLVNASGVARHARVRSGIRDMWGRDEQAAWFQEGEPGQLDRATGQNMLTWKEREETSQ